MQNEMAKFERDQTILSESPQYYFFQLDDLLCDMFHDAVVDMVSQVPHDASDTLGVEDYGWPDSHRRLLVGMLRQMSRDQTFSNAIGKYLYSLRPLSIPISMRIAKGKQMVVQRGLVGMGILLAQTPVRVGLPVSDDEPLKHRVAVWRPGQVMYFTKFGPKPLDGRLSIVWATFPRYDVNMSLIVMEGAVRLAKRSQRAKEKRRATMRPNAQHPPIKREYLEV